MTRKRCPRCNSMQPVKEFIHPDGRVAASCDRCRQLRRRKYHELLDDYHGPDCRQRINEPLPDLYQERKRCYSLAVACELAIVPLLKPDADYNYTLLADRDPLAEAAAVVEECLAVECNARPWQLDADQRRRQTA